MQIISDKEEMVFRKDFENNATYSLGLSKKDKNNNYVNGYINVVFKKGTDLQNKTKIKIKEAWLSFNQKENTTYPYIFINDFEVVESVPEEKDTFKEFGDSIKTEFDTGKQIQIEDNDLPF